MVGAELKAGRAFLIGTGGGDDGRAEGFGELDRRGADARRAAMDEEGLTGLQAAALEDIGPDGKEGLGDRTGLGERQALGSGQGIALVDHGVFGIAAAGDEGADGCSNRKAIGTLALRHHRAREFEAGNVGSARRRVVAALTLQNVGAVDAGGSDGDQDLAGAGLGDRACFRPEDLGAAGGRHADRRHRFGNARHGRRPLDWCVAA